MHLWTSQSPSAIIFHTPSAESRVIAVLDILSQDATLSDMDTLGLGIDSAGLDTAWHKGVHGLGADVEAGGGVVDGQNGDGALVDRELPACAALRAVPLNTLHAADIREARDLALGLPVVPCDEAVGAVRAGDGGQGARGVVVAGVPAYGDGLRGGDEGCGGDDGGELHGGGWNVEVVCLVGCLCCVVVEDGDARCGWCGIDDLE